MVFSDDGIGADPGCPGPVLPPLNSLGPDGRAADLRRTIGEFGGISVQEYMDRYGVGERRAQKELLRAGAIERVEEKVSGKRGKPKVKRTRFEPVDTIGEIQDSIGFTGWGFPFATREEIAQWIGAGQEDPPYPRWIMEPAPARVQRERRLG